MFSILKLDLAVDLANKKLYIMYTRNPLIKEHLIALVQLHRNSVEAVAKILRT